LFSDSLKVKDISCLLVKKRKIPYVSVLDKFFINNYMRQYFCNKGIIFITIILLFIVSISISYGHSINNSIIISPINIDTIIIHSVNETCDQGNGSVVVNAIGTGFVEYRWEDDNSAIIKDWSADSSLTNISAGSYTLFFKDGSGGEIEGREFIIGHDEAPLINLENVDIVHASCDNPNGSVTGIEVTGVPDLQFTWNGGGTWFDSPELRNTFSGNYFLDVLDGNGCLSSVGPFEIKNIGPNIDEFNSLTLAESCGDSNGSITGIVASGVTPVEYSWDEGNTWTLVSSLGVIPDFTGLNSGEYLLYVRDSSDCQSVIGSYFVSNFEGPVIDYSGEISNASCGNSNGEISGFTAIGNGYLEYRWLNGDSEEIQSWNLSSLLTNVPSGSYVVQVRDQLGCAPLEAGPFVIEDSPIPTLIGGTEICEGNEVTLIASGATKYSWSTGEISDVITASPIVTTTYVVTFTTETCVNKDSITVVVNPSIDVNAGEDQSILLGEVATLTAQSTAETYQWSPVDGLSCSNCQSIEVMPLLTTTYTVTVVGDSNSCQSTDAVTVIVDNKEVDLQFPSAFSPNEDGNNDLFRVLGGVGLIKKGHFELSVFDRWGQKVHTSKDPKIGWDGTKNGIDLNSGVFIYKMKAKLIDDSELEKNGNITLVR